MKLYDYALKTIRLQIENLHNVRAMNEEFYDSESQEAREELQEILLRDGMAMAVAVLARCDVINDSRNDQVQSSARELVSLIAKRLNIDAAEKFGVPI
jgi:DNA polymerase III delta prime subunit